MHAWMVVHPGAPRRTAAGARRLVRLCASRETNEVTIAVNPFVL